MRLAEGEFERINDLLSIEEVVRHYIPELKKAGPNNFVSLCPFHIEKTPSFTVFPEGKFQNYKCFGCLKTGDMIDFVKEIEPLCDTMTDAARLLAARYHIDIQVIEDGKELIEDKHGDVILANRYACQFFRDSFFNYKPIKRYVYERGYDTKIMVDRWKIGYAPADYHLKYDIKVLKKADLLKADGTPKFRDRLMFPILDVSGRIIGFGGRTWQRGDNRPKYLNTSETGAFRKGSHLYGLYQNRKVIKKLGYATLVEGYTDVNLTPKAVILNAVGGMGTSFTDEQAQLLARYTEFNHIFYDSGTSGEKAAANAIAKMWRYGKHSVPMRAIDGYKDENWDPASMSMTHKSKLNQFLRPHEEGDQIRVVFSQVKGTNNFEKTEELLKLIGTCPNPLKRGELIQQASDVTGHFVADLREMLNIFLPRLTFSAR